MDAPESELEVPRAARRAGLRLALVAWLAVLVAAGLWHAYGVWLFNGGGAHVR